MNVVEFEGDIYPELQTTGNAARFAMPFAKEILSGRGVDIGCNRVEWSFPGSIPIDIALDINQGHARNLPSDLDYVFSSHCLEHLDDWVGCLDYWFECLKDGGTMFLYLPHYAQKYWRPWNNRKHVSVLTPQMIRDYFEARGCSQIFVTEGYDLNHSFYGVATK